MKILLRSTTLDGEPIPGSGKPSRPPTALRWSS